MTDFKMTQDAQGIATLTWDCIGKSMNVMSFEALQQMNALIDQALADEAVKGIILTSGKKPRLCVCATKSCKISFMFFPLV